MFRVMILLAFASIPQQIYLDNLALNHPDIQYSSGPVRDAVARLAENVQNGKVTLDFEDNGWGYLTSLLTHLNIPVDSQALVFSKTSLQSDRISPRTPRAIYFNDQVAVAAVRGASVIEIASVDP